MRTSPGQARNYFIVGEATADYCDVMIAEEQIALRFDRDPDGVIRCTGRTRYDSDAASRATRHAFNEARKIAVAKLNELQHGEKRRAGFVEPIINYSDVKECSMSYAESKYSFGCSLTAPLDWDTLRLTAEEHPDKKPYLSNEEWRKLKMRALSQIQKRRINMECYGEDGLGPFTESERIRLAQSQLSLAF